MKLFALSLAAALALSVTPTLAETTWSGTGPRGSTVDGAGTCQTQSGTLSCNRTSTVTNPYGQSATRSGSRVTTSSGTTKAFTTTGQNGRSTSSIRMRNW